MVLNDEREEIIVSMPKKMAKPWKDIREGYIEKVVKQPMDLGVCQRRTTTKWHDQRKDQQGQTYQS